MSKSTKKYGWLNTWKDSSKTLIARAKREVPKFKEHILKFEEQITINPTWQYMRIIRVILVHFTLIKKLTVR